MMGLSFSILATRTPTHGVAILISKEKAKTLLEWEPLTLRTEDCLRVWEKAARGGGMCSPQVTRYVVKGQGSKVSEVKVTQRKVSPWDVLFFFLWSV
ncbi:unnamed protein product [Gadus morhua 'NCC']